MKTRFCVNVGETERALFSIREKKNSQDNSATDLNVHFSGGAKSRQGITLEDLVVPVGEAQYHSSNTHFSVHANPSRTSTNTVTRRFFFGNSEERTERGSVLVTKGIKTGRFVPILFRICGDLQNDRFDVRNNRQDVISLGNFDPARDQLRFMVLIAQAGKHFPKHEEHPSNLLQRGFNDYEVVVIWSYFNFPAMPHAINIVPFSTEETGPSEGLEWWESYNWYTNLNAAYSDSYFRRLGE